MLVWALSLLVLPAHAVDPTCMQIECRSAEFARDPDVMARMDECLNVAACVLSELSDLDPENRTTVDDTRDDPGRLDPKQVAARFDSLKGHQEAIRAFIQQNPGKPELERVRYMFYEQFMPIVADPELKVMRDRIAPSQEETDPKTGPVVAVRPPVKVETTPAKRDEAVAKAEKAEAQLSAQPEPDPVKAVAAAKDFLRGAEPAGAERVLDRLIEGGQDDPEALRLRGTARYQQSDWTGAAEDAEAALKRNPKDAYAKDLAGAARMMERRLGLKAPSLKPSAEKKPEEDGGVSGGERWSDRRVDHDGKPDLKRWLADVARMIRIGDRKTALRDLTRILGRDPANVKALALHAHLMNRAKDPGAALRDTDKALALSPDDPDGLREHAYALIQLGRAAEALALLDRAIKLEPGNALGYLYRGKAYEALGRTAESQADYARAFAIDPALRHFFDEEAGPATAPARGVPFPLPPPWLVRKASFLLGLPLVLWALWRGYRVTAGATTRRTAAAAPEPADTLVPGTVLGGSYRVERVLGRGGMGMVYEATDLALERRVAVKQLRTPEESPELAERFVREARIVARLTHERIVQIFALVEEGGHFFMVFERIDGRSLDAELADRRRLEARDVLSVVRDVCAALETAHAAGVIHRDLKPANVMRAANGRCKVMDFGIAHQSSGGGLTRTEPWGTPPYMAPEQEQGTVCPETDLYALACMAYELLTGARPFGATADKLALRFPQPSSSGLPEALDGFMLKALAPRPEARFRSAGEFLKAFEGCLQTPRIGA